MSYSPIGTLYAAAGLGLGPSGISPPFRRYGFRSFDGLGADPGEAVSKPVRDLQILLMEKGYNVGPSGADNTWGSNTGGALNRALRRDVSSQISVSADKHTIRMPVSFWTELAALGRGAGGEALPTPAPTPSPSPAPTTPEEVPETIAGGEDLAMQIVPWAVAGTVLVGIAGYFIYSGRKRRAVAANRRRRRRRSSRRRRA